MWNHGFKNGPNQMIQPEKLEVGHETNPIELKISHKFFFEKSIKLYELIMVHMIGSVFFL